MMEIKQSYVSAFENENGTMFFCGAHVFSKGNKFLLLGNNGNIILLDRHLYQAIENKTLNDDLWFKLIQRKLAFHEHNPIVAMKENVRIRPTYFMIDMTSRCNMGCRYCLRDSEESLHAKVIDKDTLLQICDYIIEYCRQNHLGQIYIQPWGGEPLLEKEKIFLIQEHMKENDINAIISIETNGLLLSEELIKELYNKDIGYGISIDGYADVHDKQRTLSNGMGTHERIEKAIRTTQKYYGEYTSVLATVTRQSASHIGEIIDYFANELCLKKIKINFVHKSVFQDEDEFCVTREDIKAVMEQMLEKIVFLNENNVDIMEYNLWVKMLNVLTNRKIDACISRGCTGGRNMITFDVKGNIYPCDVTDFPEEKLGSIYDSCALNEMVEKAMQEKDYFAEKVSDDCKDCPWKHFCNGGCSVHVKCAGEKAGSVDYIECTANKTIYPKIIELILNKEELINRMVGYEIL